MDSDTALWPDTLPVPLATPRARMAPRGERMEMETGRVRKRRTVEEALEVWEVQWNFTEDQFAGFKDFFEQTLENGSLPFLIELFDDVKGMAFADGKYAFDRSDNLVMVSAVLELLEEGSGV